MKETIAILLAYLTCDDPVVQNKYTNLLNSFWHKDNGHIISGYSVNGNGDVTFTLTDGDGVSDTVSIPQFIMPSSMPMSYIDGLVAALNAKVDTVVGKQLSTEDFTTALLNKLNTLEPYIHPAFHEVSEINGLQTIIDELQNQVDNKLPMGGYTGTAQNLKDELDDKFAAINIADITQVNIPGYYKITSLEDIGTNVKWLSTNEDLLLSDFEHLSLEEVLVLRSSEVRPGISFDVKEAFIRNFPNAFDHIGTDVAALNAIVPTEPSVARIALTYNNEIGYFAYYYFDPGNADGWVVTGYDIYYDPYGADVPALITLLQGQTAPSDPRPHGVILLNSLSNEVYFLNISDYSWSDAIPTAQILDTNVRISYFFYNSDLMGYAITPGVLDNAIYNDYYGVQYQCIVSEQFLRKQHIDNIYADYNQADTGKPDYRYVKTTIKAVDADWDSSYLIFIMPFLTSKDFRNINITVITAHGEVQISPVISRLGPTVNNTNPPSGRVYIKDLEGYISPFYEASEYIIEFSLFGQGQGENVYDTRKTQTGTNILISDIDVSHSAAMASWVVHYHPDFQGQVIESIVDLGAVLSTGYSPEYSKEVGANIIVEANTSSYFDYPYAIADTLYVAAHGNNTPTRFDRTSAPEVFRDNFILVGAGLESDTDETWQTSYGYGVEFIEPTRAADVPGVAEPLNAVQHEQSPATAFVAGKLKRIKDETGVSWAIVRRAARETASRAGNWDMYRGYGVIDVTAAINWIDTNFGTLSEDMADRYADMFGQSDRLTYSDIHQNTPLPKRSSVGKSTGTANPTTTDAPDNGNALVWKNLTNGEVRMWYNDDGTMIASAPFVVVP